MAGTTRSTGAASTADEPRTSGSAGYARAAGAGRPAAVQVPIGDPGGRIAGLDGIRALAVAAVVVYHVDTRLLPGGFLGVDVFFALSGFLITTLLLREIRRSGRVDLVGFWARRFRRLLPAVAVLIVTVFPLAWLVHRDLTVNAGRQILGAATFTTNWLEIIAGTSYFDQTAPHLLKNLWSLAIEEQFYWLWPILLVVLVRVTGGLRALERTAAGARSKLTVAARNRMIVIGAVALVSMLLMGALVSEGQDATRVYYGTDTHLYGLALGAVLAFAWSAPEGMFLGRAGWRRAAPFVGIGALVVLLTLALVLDEGSVWTYRGGLQAANLTTVALVAAVLNTPALARVLELRPLAWLGERSYGLYLWHWPAILIALQVVPAAPGTTRRVLVAGAGVLVALVITELSFRFVEQPVRRMGFRGTLEAVRGTLTSAGRGVRRAVIAVLVVAGLLVAATVVVALTAPEESETAGVIAAKEAEIEAQRQAEFERVANLGDRTMPSGEDITAFGDSLVVTSKDGLEATLPGIDINAKSIRRWGDGLAAARADMEQGRVRRAVIVDFGTNAGIEDEQVVRDFLDLLGPERMVVLVNTSSPSSWVAQSNATLERLAADYPNAIVADWNAAVAQEPGVLQSDAIHPTLRGAYLYADVVRRAFADLSQRLTGQPVVLEPGPTWPQ